MWIPCPLDDRSQRREGVGGPLPGPVQSVCVWGFEGFCQDRPEVESLKFEATFSVQNQLVLNKMRYTRRDIYTNGQQATRFQLQS